ncbi:pyridoxal phosphate-dependent transferase [Chaetomidium leptoderma]|uniref:Pyridoxal phosphate-dependent transferase n=1 Tax=Chaetomidium leptoderma TaxID=669021 RepID=A0AAN6VF58_9PEZI|nr:pyridoxal phosphate-dependent transferase [Chaetomidium leptoderma]
MDPILDPWKPRAFPLGTRHPPGEKHAVSVSLPTWQSVVKYSRDTECNSPSNLSRKVTTGYPRFDIHEAVQILSRRVIDRLRLNADERRSEHERVKHIKFLGSPEIVRFSPPTPDAGDETDHWTTFYTLLFPGTCLDHVLWYWRDAGCGMSSRQAEYCLEVFDNLKSESANNGYCTRGRENSPSVVGLPSGQAEKQALKGLIAHLATSENNNDGSSPVSPGLGDVFLFPTGMNAIHTVSRALVSLPGQHEVIGYGWLYTETRTALERGAWDGIALYHKGSAEELDDLDAALTSGQHIQALFCEFPGNVLLASPDLLRIHALATKYNFIVVCDDSVSTAVNTDILPFVDIVVTSLTKMFSGGGNVTAGRAVLNPQSHHYTSIKSRLAAIYEDTLFPLDAITLQKNSTDILSRFQRANDNALAVVDLLTRHPSVARVNHPSVVPTAALYNRHRRARGGSGHLLSIVFRNPRSAEVFYDGLDVCKGTSFGTNFTLCIPFVILAHYRELDWVESLGIAKHLLRLSVGVEDTEEILRVVSRALADVEEFEGM